MNPLGDDLLPLLVMALGGALAAGNLLAVFRPPAQTREGSSRRAPSPAACSWRHSAWWPSSGPSPR
ncbi:MAG: hypothetical protein R2705_07345 [Ilumatobacteraceae bacterium]